MFCRIAGVENLDPCPAQPNRASALESPDRGVLGTIDVESDHVDAFSPEDERFLELCAVALEPLWN